MSVLPLAALLIVGEMPVPRIMGLEGIEFQLRRALTSGIGHAVIYSERVTSVLLGIVDRMRAEGYSIDLARTIADAAEYIHPDEALVMLAPDVVVTHDRLAALVASEGPLLLCVRDAPANNHFERIDATARWTGFARIDGGLLRRTADMVGDWDLASTLMRRAVQEGAARMTLTPDEVEADLIMIESAAAAQHAGRRLIAASPVAPDGWGTHWLLSPLARLLARLTADAGGQAQWFTLSAFVLLGIAVACALAGWVAASLVTLLIALLLEGAGHIGTRAGAATMQWEKLRFPLRAGAATIVALAMGTTLTFRTMQWGCLVLAVVLVGATWLAGSLRNDDPALARWRSDPAGHAVIGIVGFVAGAPVLALALGAVHAVISFIWGLRKALARP